MKMVRLHALQITLNLTALSASPLTGTLLSGQPPGVYREIYEAEDAVFTYKKLSVCEMNSIPGYSGSGYYYSTSNSGADIEFELELQETKGVKILIHYSNASGTDCSTSIDIDGNTIINDFQFESYSSWTIWDDGGFDHLLPAGVHTLRLSPWEFHGNHCSVKD